MCDDHASLNRLTRSLQVWWSSCCPVSIPSRTCCLARPNHCNYDHIDCCAHQTPWIQVQPCVPAWTTNCTTARNFTKLVWLQIR